MRKLWMPPVIVVAFLAVGCAQEEIKHVGAGPNGGPRPPADTPAGKYYDQQTQQHGGPRPPGGWARTK